MLLYTFGFFLLYALLLALPALLEGARQLGPGSRATPEDLERASAIAQHALEGRLPLALAAALLSVGLGVWRGALPGLHRPGAPGGRGRRV